MKMLTEDTDPHRAIGVLGRFMCGACWGHGYEVLEEYEPITKRIPRDDWKDVKRHGMALFRVKWTYKPCEFCNGFGLVDRLVSLVRIAESLRATFCSLTVLLVALLCSCASPAVERAPWHLELEGGRAVVVAGPGSAAPQRTASVDVTHRARSTSYYDLVVWRLALARYWEREHE